MTIKANLYKRVKKDGNTGQVSMQLIMQYKKNNKISL